jgi:glyoxalase family protein
VVRFIKIASLPFFMLHHITAITERVKENYDFYVNKLGMTFVKKTVNFDDPTTYHLYYGDSQGSPGSLITFFYYEGKGERGKGFAEGIILEVPEKIYDALGAVVHDPDGLILKLRRGEDYKLLGVITSASKDFLEKFDIDSDNEYVVYDSPGFMGAGLIHHVAHQAKDDVAQLEFKKFLEDSGVDHSEVIDRIYFKSLYFKDENGCLQELATNGPGFFIDEKVLGSKLRLPPWYEPYRKEIEGRLPDL